MFYSKKQVLINFVNYGKENRGRDKWQEKDDS